MNLEIDPNNKTIAIKEVVMFDEFVAEIQNIIPDLTDYRIIPNETKMDNGINNHFIYSNSTANLPG